uniref:AbrB/MazE/SpoVT family DNA-binding domain-containing protein n=1 Tax=Ignisphaera aggregans TaxID=334771 RepID=A0A7J2U507_9CREN
MHMSEDMFCINLKDRENATNFAAKVWRVGESLVITIPRAYVEKLKIREGDVLDVAVKVLKHVQR